MKTGSGILLVALLVAGCAVSEKSLVEKGATPLSGAQIQQLNSPGAVANWRNQEGRSGTVAYLAEGKVEIKSGTFSDVGSLRYTENGVCSKYTTVRNGAETCFKMYKTGPNSYATVNQNGEVESTSVFKP